MTQPMAIAIIRHNTSLGGDLRLAIREIEALAGRPATRLSSRGELRDAVGNDPIARVPELRPGDDIVALTWMELDLQALNRLLRRSAFLQELILPVGRFEELRAHEEELVAPFEQVRSLDGGAIVALAWGYIIESEGVLGGERLERRVQKTVSLLLEPYISPKASPNSRRLRKAKKTTLSLSHDLHIYKAKFFPRMVRAFLNIYGWKGARIVDPFCGSGTALLEASLLGYDSVGVDVDPICQMITRTKVNPFLEREVTLEAMDRFEAALDEDDKTPSNFSFPDELFRKIERRDKKNETSFLSEITTEAAQLARVVEKLSTDGLDTDLLRVIASDAVTKKIRYRFIGVGNGKYTIEILKQPILDRVREKIHRVRQLCSVFGELQDDFGLTLGRTEVHSGDARDASSWGLNSSADIIITSPPYLPASSGREHYSASRALAFSVLGIEHGCAGYYNVGGTPSHSGFDVSAFPEADALMAYLMSDASDAADPQRDAMRFERKAMPTLEYLEDMQSFFEATNAVMSPSGHLLLVVANQHTFYSHRRQVIEHVVSGPDLYGELAQSKGIVREDVVKMELLKSAVSKARPRATEDYFEAVIVSKKGSLHHDEKKMKEPEIANAVAQ